MYVPSIDYDDWDDWYDWDDDWEDWDDWDDDWWNDDDWDDDWWNDDDWDDDWWNDDDDWYEWCDWEDDVCEYPDCDEGNYCYQTECWNDWCGNYTCTREYYDDDWNLIVEDCSSWRVDMDADEIASRIGDQIGIEADDVEELVGTALDIASDEIADRLDGVFGENSNSGRVIDEILSNDEFQDSISDVFEAVLPGLNDFFGSFTNRGMGRKGERP